MQSISKLTAQAQNQYLDILLDPSFQGVFKVAVEPFVNIADKQSLIELFNSGVEIEDYNVMIDGRKVFDQPLKNNEQTYDNI